MNLRVVLISTFFLCLVTSQGCPDNCQSCAGPLNCTTCRPGFFLASKTECKPCPQECKTCSIGTNGMPVCALCNEGFQLSTTKQCLACIPGCSKCAESSDKCTACLSGYKLITISTPVKVNAVSTTTDTTSTAKIVTNATNTTTTTATAPVMTSMQCVQDSASCTEVKNCKLCAGKINQQVCGVCSQKYYNFRRGCQRCRAPCLGCNLNLQSLWGNSTLPFWNTTLAALKLKVEANIPKKRLLTQQKVYNQTYKNWTLADWNASSWTSKKLKNFTEMNITDVKGWTEAYFFFKAAETQLAKTDTLVNLIYNCLPIFEEVLNLTYDSQSQWNHLAKYLSKYSGKKWNAANLNDKIAQISSKNATCSSCVAGYSLNATTGACIKCPQDCITCTNLTACTVCRPGFMISGKNCVRCSPSCLQCSKVPSSCTACKLPLLPLNGSCVRCHPSCKSCSSPMDASGCLTCASQYSLYPFQKSCYKCNDPQCKQCDGLNKNLCLACKDGSALVGGKCIDCPSGCKSCSTFNSSVICYECKTSYVLAANKTCSRCVDGCQRCSKTNTSICLVCENQRYFDFKTRGCKGCPDGCSKCSSNLQCIEAEDGVVVAQGKTVKCPPGCTKCNYENPLICLSCQIKYYLEGSECRKCKDGCTECTKASCLACANNYNLANGLCVQCSPSCATCNQTNISQCFTCKRGLQLMEGGVCSPSTAICKQGCTNCNTTSPDKCLECGLGFALKDDKKCTKCLRGCNGKCNPKNITQCLSCMDGFALIKNTCTACPYGCSLCPDGVCTTCIQGFKFDINSSTCTIACQFPCSTCDLSPCDTCQAGYVKQGNICVANVSCNPECGNCPIGTYQKSDTLQCVRCGNNCAICALGVCSSCYEGFYLNNKSLCDPCTSPCRTCYSNSTCKACSDGYIKQVIVTGATVSEIVYGDNCVQCDENCQTCTIFKERCTSCKMGWRLKGQKCIKLYGVKFMYRLDTDYRTFLQNGTIDSVMNSISKKLNISLQKTDISNLTEGSTIIEGTIEVQNTDEAATVQYQLSASGGFNNALLDTNVLNSTFDKTYYDDILPQINIVSPSFNPTDFYNSQSSSSNSSDFNESLNNTVSNSSNSSNSSSIQNSSSTSNSSSASNSSSTSNSSSASNSSGTKLKNAIQGLKKIVRDGWVEHQLIFILVLTLLITVVMILIACCCCKCCDSNAGNNQNVRCQVANTQRYGETTNTNHMLQIPEENAEQQESEQSPPSQQQPIEKQQSQSYSQSYAPSQSRLPEIKQNVQQKVQSAVQPQPAQQEQEQDQDQDQEQEQDQDQEQDEDEHNNADGDNAANLQVEVKPQEKQDQEQQQKQEAGQEHEDQDENDQIEQDVQDEQPEENHEQPKQKPVQEHQ